MGEKWKQWQILFSRAPKSWQTVTTAMKLKDACSLGKKTTTNLDSILKSRDITLPVKVHIVKAMVFLVIMNGCESWTIKKATHQRTDAFELLCWRRLLGIPWTARRWNQSILKEIYPEYSSEWLMKLHYWPSHAKSWLTGKEHDAWKDWRQKEKEAEDEMIRYCHQVNGHEFEWTLGDSGGQRRLEFAVHVIAKKWTQLSDWAGRANADKDKEQLRHCTIAGGRME